MQRRPSIINRWIMLLAGSPLQRGCIAVCWGAWVLLPRAFDNPSYKYFQAFGPLVWALLALAVGGLQIDAAIRGSGWRQRFADGCCAVFFMTLSLYFLFATPTSTAVPVYGMLGIGALASLMREHEVWRGE